MTGAIGRGGLLGAALLAAALLPAAPAMADPAACARANAFIQGQSNDGTAALADAEACLQGGDRAEGLVTRAFVFYRLSRWLECNRDLESAVPILPPQAPSLDIIGVRAQCRAGLGRHDDAISDFTTVLTSRPDDTGALMGRGDSFVAMQRYPLAIGDYKRVLALKPGDPAALQKLAAAEQLDSGGAPPQTPSQNPPQTPPAPAGQGAEALNDLGHEAYLAGNDQLAVQYFTQAIAADPNYALAYGNRGAAYTNLDMLDLALADLDTAIRLDPNEAYFFRNRGTVHRRQGRCEAAVNDQTEALRLEPGNARALEERGRCYVTLTRYRDAIADLTAAIAANPDSAVAYGMRGTAHHNLKEHMPALADYQKALALDPKYGLIVGNLCGLHYDMGQFQEALKRCEEALVLDPGDQWVIDLKAKVEAAIAAAAGGGQ